MPEVGVARRGRAAGGLAAVAVAALALAMVALVYANTSSEWPASVMMSEGQRTTKLAWGGFTLDMQKEANVLDSQVTKTHAYTHTTYVCVSIMCFVYAHTCW